MKRITQIPRKTFLGGLLVALLPFLQRSLYLGRLYYGRDFTEIIGARSYFYQQLRQGKLVLWDSLQATGIPFASYIYDLFSPLSLPYVFLLQDGYLRSTTAQWLLTIHCAIGAVGAYLLGLNLKLGRTAAVVMGVVMGCCGVVTIKSVEPMMIHTFAWAPFVFLFLHRARERSRLLESLWAGLFLGLAFMAGHPQIFYYIGIAVFLYALYWLIIDTEHSGSRSAWTGALRLYLPLTISFILTSLPHFSHMLMDMLFAPPPSIFASADNRLLLAHSQDGSADFGYLYNFLFPTLEGGHSEMYFYVGIMPLVLAWVAVLHLRRDPASGFWKFLVLIALLLMMGGNLGLHKILVDVLPGFKYFRFPSRWVFLVHLGVLILAGYGLDRLLASTQPEEFSGFSRVLAVLCGSLVLISILAWLLYHLTTLMLKRPADSLIDERSMRLIVQSVTGTVFLLAATWFVFRRIREGERGPAVRFLIVAAVILDLAFYHPSTGVNLNTAWTMRDFGPDPSEVTGPMDAFAREMAALAGESPARLVIGVHKVRTPWERDIHQSALYRYRVRSFYPIDGYPERLHPDGYWRLVDNVKEMPRAVNLLGGRILETEREEPKSNRSAWFLMAYSQAAIRLAPGTQVVNLAVEGLAEHPAPHESGTPVAEVGLWTPAGLVGPWPLTPEQLGRGTAVQIPMSGPVEAAEVLLASIHPRVRVHVKKVWINGSTVSDSLQLTPVTAWASRNEQAQPPAFFVSRAAGVGARHDYQKALLSLDPSRCVLFKEDRKGSGTEGHLTPDPGGTVSILKWEDQDVRLKVQADRPGYLVMTQSAYPGWTGWVDGRKTPILRAFGFLMALPIGPGSHQVRLAYSAPWLVAGLIVAPLWVLGLFFWTFRRKKADLRRNTPDAPARARSLF
ncbi:MAG: YfhO family protein [Deltaproteobacteria bacterium]|nr:YfhO family protein [Deltaproteobacteria bacterium]